MAEQGPEQPAAGWYSDPEGSGAWRWWDGQRWGELAPAEEAASAPGGQVLFRAWARSTQRAHVKDKELVVTNDWLTLDQDAVAIDEIDQAAFWRTWFLGQTWEYRRGHF